MYGMCTLPHAISWLNHFITTSPLSFDHTRGLTRQNEKETDVCVHGMATPTSCFIYHSSTLTIHTVDLYDNYVYIWMTMQTYKFPTRPLKYLIIILNANDNGYFYKHACWTHYRGLTQ